MLENSICIICELYNTVDTTIIILVIPPSAYRWYIYLLLYSVHSPGFYNNIHNIIMTYYILYLWTFRFLVVFSFGRGRDRRVPPTYSYAYVYILTILCRHGSATSARLHCDPSRTCSARFYSTRHAGQVRV